MRVADVLVRIAIIGFPRLRQEYHGLEPDRDPFLLWVAQEAIPEGGHTCDLRHCPDTNCTMHFSNSLSDTDAKDPRFCIACRNRCDR
ncbi:MAG TPA: hypothetical protein VEI57_11710 [Nitrospirota bacterium]|nr:hypothetical protein [Nitrospirota bacterium]